MRLFRRPSKSAVNRGAGGFNPLSLGNVALWLDGADASTTQTTGSVIDQWNDKSGNGLHLTSSGSARPTLSLALKNGKNVVVFDGVNDILSRSNTNLAQNVGGVTAYIVRIRGNQAASAQTTFGVSNGTGLGLNRFTIGDGIIANQQFLSSRRLDADLVTTTNGTTPVGTTAWHITTAVANYTNGTRDIYFDSVSDGSTSGLSTGNTSDTVSLGVAVGARADGAAFSNTSIGEIIMYHDVHDTDTRAIVEAYLTAKWGL